MEKNHPIFFRLENARDHYEIKIQVKDHHESFHPFIIGKERAIRIGAKKVGQKNYSDKHRNRFEDRIEAWPEFFADEGKTNPKGKNDFNDYTKSKILPRNKREEHA